jgi:hypothetical protein
MRLGLDRGGVGQFMGAGWKLGPLGTPAERSRDLCRNLVKLMAVCGWFGVIGAVVLGLVLAHRQSGLRSQGEKLPTLRARPLMNTFVYEAIRECHRAGASKILLMRIFSGCRGVKDLSLNRCVPDLWKVRLMPSQDRAGTADNDPPGAGELLRAACAERGGSVLIGEKFYARHTRPGTHGRNSHRRPHRSRDYLIRCIAPRR